MGRGMIDTISDNMTTMSISKVRYDSFVVAERKLNDLEDLIANRRRNGEGITASEVNLLYELMIMPPVNSNEETEE